MERLSELIESEISAQRWTEECADWPCIGFQLGKEFDDKLWVNVRVNANETSQRTLNTSLRGAYDESGLFIRRVLEGLPSGDVVSHSSLMHDFSGNNNLQIEQSYVAALGVHLFKIELFIDDDMSRREFVTKKMAQVIKGVYNLNLPSAMFDVDSCLRLGGQPEDGIIVSGSEKLSQGSLPEREAYTLIDKLKPALAKSELEMLGRYNRGLIEKRTPVCKREVIVLSRTPALSVGDLRQSLERFEKCDYMRMFSVPSGDYLTHSADDGKVSLNVITGAHYFAETLDRVWNLYQLIHPTPLEQAKLALAQSRSTPKASQH